MRQYGEKNDKQEKLQRELLEKLRKESWCMEFRAFRLNFCKTIRETNYLRWRTVTDDRPVDIQMSLLAHGFYQLASLAFFNNLSLKHVFFLFERTISSSDSTEVFFNI